MNDECIQQEAEEDLLAATWFKLTDVEHIVYRDLNWPAERDFITADSYILLVSDAQEGRLIVSGQFVQLKQGTAFISKPGQLLELGLQPEDVQGVYLLRFQAFRVAQAETGNSAALQPLHSLPGEGEAIPLAPAAAVQLAKVVHTHFLQGQPADRLRSEAGLYELLSLVLQNQAHKTAMALDYAKYVLERNFTEEITIESLAATAGLSRFHFMRLFKEKFGKGVIEYVTELRLRKAKSLMRELPNASLREIAYQVGYKNEMYLSNMFKKHMGMAPAVYMKNSNLKVAAYSWVNIGQLLALQVIPYAAPMDQYWTDYYRNKYAYDVQVSLSHHYDFNRLALEQAKPDYIIGIDWIPPEEQEKLGSIATALFLPWQASWRKQLLEVAAFIHKTKESAKWLHNYDRKAAELKAVLKPRLEDRPVLIVLIHLKQLLVWGKAAATVFYDDLGLKAPDQLHITPWVKKIDPAKLADYEAGHIILHVAKDSVSQAAWQAIAKEDAWCELPAVRAGNVTVTSGIAGIEAPWNEYSAFGQERLLHHAAAMFEAAAAPK
ncbi:AraC family transcriptional regulator [Paenibacillus oryzisoli]|uniref:helix-turn-helix domain-containing protein n=1 Tax=Paenibacillus oryzisoli TaxID=1850517 RepID=UPI003D294B17